MLYSIYTFCHSSTFRSKDLSTVGQNITIHCNLYLQKTNAIVLSHINNSNLCGLTAVTILFCLKFFISNIGSRQSLLISYKSTLMVDCVLKASILRNSVLFVTFTCTRDITAMTIQSLCIFTINSGKVNNVTSRTHFAWLLFNVKYKSGTLNDSSNCIAKLCSVFNTGRKL